MGDTKTEFAFLNSITAGFPRSEFQKNKIHESDAELIEIPGHHSLLAVTTDNIVEEIELGLYTDYYLMGWMSVVVNLSDLSAVGAAPFGLLLSQTFLTSSTTSEISLIQNGIKDACEAFNVPVLGGDTNFSSKMQLGATALGYVDKNYILTRIGAAPSDILFVSHPVGSGSAFAFMAMNKTNIPGLENLYKPIPRLKEGSVLNKYASACIDTSDGFIPAINSLMELNNVGMSVKSGVSSYVNQMAAYVTGKAGIPDWFLLAGPHGEFELLFTVPAEKYDEFIQSANSIDWQPIKLGVVTADKSLQMDIYEKDQIIDCKNISNLFTEVGGDVGQYIKELSSINQKLI